MHKNKQIKDEFLQRILTPKEYKELTQDNDAYEQSLHLYTSSFIQSVDIHKVNQKRFIIPKSEQQYLRHDWTETLNHISLHQPLINPVYVNVAPSGQLIID